MAAVMRMSAVHALRNLERKLNPLKVVVSSKQRSAATCATRALFQIPSQPCDTGDRQSHVCFPSAAQHSLSIEAGWRILAAANQIVTGTNGDFRGFNCMNLLGGRRRLRTEVAKEVSVTYLEGNLKGAVVMSLERPHAKNALGRALLDQLQEAIQSIDGNRSVRAVVLQSAVPKVFCAGADLKERKEMTVDGVRDFVRELGATFRSLEELRMPTVAAIEGHALGGGLELALSCDLRVGGQNARLGLPETGLAIIPGAGGTQRLPRLVGASKAKELIFTGRIVDAQEAWRIGLINHLVGPGEAYDKALEVVAEILKKGPVAIEAAKTAIDHGMQLQLGHALEVEQQMYETTLTTSDRLEGLAAFAEKRAPVYTGE